MTFASTIPILRVLVNQQITMKLTDIDLSSLAEVAAAITLLDSVHVRLATGGVPLPSLPPVEFVVNPAPELPRAEPAPGDSPNWSRPDAMERALAADAENLRGLGVDPMSGQPLPGFVGNHPTAISGMYPAAPLDTEKLRGLGVDLVMPGETGTLDAASIFGATAQSAAPLPLAPSTAGAAPSPTALAALPASGALPALQALAPLPVASAAAPAAPAAPASPAGGVEVDADGLPWHESIHAGTKRKNADGRWTAKRGINDPDLVPRVVAQLRAQMAAGGVTTLTQLQANVVPPVPAQSAGPLPVSTPAQSTTPLAALPVTSGPVSSAAPTPPALPGLPPQAAPQPSSGAKPVPLTFQDFMTAMTVEVMSGRVPATALLEACKPYGGTTALAANPAPIPEIWAALKHQYPGML